MFYNFLEHARLVLRLYRFFAKKSARTSSVIAFLCAKHPNFSAFSVRSAFLAKCWPAAANVTVRSRERELRQARARRACLWPCLVGLASPESFRGRARECRRLRSGWPVVSSPRLVLSSSSLCCRAIRFFAEYCADGAAAFGDRKSRFRSKSGEK